MPEKWLEEFHARVNGMSLGEKGEIKVSFVKTMDLCNFIVINKIPVKMWYYLESKQYKPEDLILFFEKTKEPSLLTCYTVDNDK